MATACSSYELEEDIDMTSATTEETSGTDATQAAWLGLDIGGANLKAAHSFGWTSAMPFPMWKEHGALACGIARLIDTAPPFDGVAVTMTGELADCFPTRAAGVAMILEQVTRLLPAPAVRVYCVDGRWRSPAQAAREPWKAAASNWHALAQWSSRMMHHRAGILIDIGSTTIDVIPMRAQGVATTSKTDSDRLRRGELLYTGVERSNLAGLVRTVPLFGGRCPVMNEQFATTRDAYLWLGYLAPDPDDHLTADGRPATRTAARSRLARIVGEDESTLADADVTAIAEHVLERQARMLSKAIARVERRLTGSGAANGSQACKEPPCDALSLVFSGHGGFLVERALAGVTRFGETVRWDAVLGPDVSRSAPAYAVCKLAAESPELRSCLGFA